MSRRISVSSSWGSIRPRRRRWASLVHKYPANSSKRCSLRSSQKSSRQTIAAVWKRVRPSPLAMNLTCLADSGTSTRASFTMRNASGLIHRIVGVCIDTTDFKRAQEQALARQKLESLGVLAGGIAHDFNNLLGGILAEAELVQADFAAGLPPGEEVARIKA